MKYKARIKNSNDTLIYSDYTTIFVATNHYVVLVDGNYEEVYIVLADTIEVIEEDPPREIDEVEIEIKDYYTRPLSRRHEGGIYFNNTHRTRALNDGYIELVLDKKVYLIKQQNVISKIQHEINVSREELRAEGDYSYDDAYDDLVSDIRGMYGGYISEDDVF